MAEGSLRERHRAWRVARLRMAEAQAALSQPLPLGRSATPPEVRARQRELLFQEAERRERRARERLMEVGPDGALLVKETLLPILKRRLAETDQSLRKTQEKLEELVGHPLRKTEEPSEDAEHDVREYHQAWRQLEADVERIRSEIASLESL
ncbi:MAG: hypothetical protein ACE5NC_03230 [Anaerolineae bacterium]